MKASPALDGVTFGDVPAASVDSIWHLVAPLLGPACDYADDDITVDELRASLLAGDRMLWIALRGRDLLMALVVEVYDTPRRRICLILSAGGHPSVPWPWIAAQIETFAAERGCKRVRIVGRKGWMKKLPDYRATCVVLSKDLACEG